MSSEKKALKEKAKGRSWIVRFLLYLGIEIPREKKWHLQIHRRLFKICGILFVIFIIFLAFLTKYSTSPRFCKSCHIMQPYYNAWLTSNHNKVACVQCHYPPGQFTEHLWDKFQALSQVVKYVTRTYSSKPYAEISDQACLRKECHSTRLLEGKIVSKSTGIRFDHRPHLLEKRRGRQLRCTSCHSQIVIGTHVEVTWSTCFLCHFRGFKQGREFNPLGGCLSCHKVPKKTFMYGKTTFNHEQIMSHKNVTCQECHLDVVIGEGEVNQERCVTCHNQPEKLAKFNDMEFIHTNHIVKHHVACLHCHKEIQHTGKAIFRKVDFDCEVCHTHMHDSQKMVYMGKGSKIVPEIPSPMYLANVDCVACHISKINGATLVEKHEETTYVFDEKGCITCHGENYRGMVSNWRSYLSNTEKLLSEKIRLVTAILEKEPDKPVLEKKLSEINHDINYVKGSRGIHNIYFAALILQKSNENLDKLLEKYSDELMDISDDPIISGRFCGTMCHQSAGINVPPKKVTYEEVEMPHEDHYEIMACTVCHTFGSHKEVKFTAKDDVCLECH